MNWPFNFALLAKPNSHYSTQTNSMAKLDVYGKLAAAEIAFYIPLTLVAFILSLRHGFRRDGGWVFLFIFGLIRIAGSAVYLAAELKRPVNADLYTAAGVLQSVGVSPLLFATLGFLGLAGRESYSQSNRRLIRGFRLIGFIILGAVGVSVAGGVQSNSTQPSDRESALNLRRVGAILLGVAFLLVVYCEAICWSYRRQITRHRKILLVSVICALPFLGVRIAYSIINAWSTTVPSLMKFNSVNGTWWIYLVMALIMEYMVALIYVVAGTLVPLRKNSEYV